MRSILFSNRPFTTVGDIPENGLGQGEQDPAAENQGDTVPAAGGVGGVLVRVHQARWLWYPDPRRGFRYRSGGQRVQVSHFPGPEGGRRCNGTRPGGHQAEDMQGPLHPRGRLVPAW